MSRSEMDLHDGTHHSPGGRIETYQQIMAAQKHQIDVYAALVAQLESALQQQQQTQGHALPHPALPLQTLMPSSVGQEDVSASPPPLAVWKASPALVDDDDHDGKGVAAEGNRRRATKRDATTTGRGELPTTIDDEHLLSLSSPNTNHNTVAGSGGDGGSGAASGGESLSTSSPLQRTLPPPPAVQPPTSSPTTASQLNGNAVRPLSGTTTSLDPALLEEDEDDDALLTVNGMGSECPSSPMTLGGGDRNVSITSQPRHHQTHHNIDQNARGAEGSPPSRRHSSGAMTPTSLGGQSPLSVEGRQRHGQPHRRSLFTDPQLSSHHEHRHAQPLPRQQQKRTQRVSSHDGGAEEDGHLVYSPRASSSSIEQYNRRAVPTAVAQQQQQRNRSANTTASPPFASASEEQNQRRAHYDDARVPLHSVLSEYLSDSTSATHRTADDSNGFHDSGDFVGQQERPRHAGTANTTTLVARRRYAHIDDDESTLDVPPPPIGRGRGDGAGAAVSREKYVSLKAKYFALKHRMEESAAHSRQQLQRMTSSWRHLWTQQVVDHGQWKTVVRMCPEGGVVMVPTTTNHHNGATHSSAARSNSGNRTSPQRRRSDQHHDDDYGSSTASPSSLAGGAAATPPSVSGGGASTLLTFGANGPMKARVDQLIRRTVSSWDAAKMIVLQEMPACRCGGSALVTVQGPSGTGRASAAHDVAVAALVAFGELLDAMHPEHNSAPLQSPQRGGGVHEGGVTLWSGRVRVTAIVCDGDDAWSLPSQHIHEDVFCDKKAPREASSAAVITPLFHERRAKFSGCHLLLFIDAVIANDVPIARSRPFSRFLLADVVPSSPTSSEVADSGADATSGALLSLVNWQRVAFLRKHCALPGVPRSGASTPSATSPSHHHGGATWSPMGASPHSRQPTAAEEFETSSPVINLIHAFLKERHVSQAVLVALVSPLHQPAVSWRTIAAVARVKRAASRRASSSSHSSGGTIAVELPQHEEGHNNEDGAPGQPYHAYDADVTGVLEWEATLCS